MEKYKDPLYKYVYGIEDEQGEENRELDTTPVEEEDAYTKAKRERSLENVYKLRKLRRDPEDTRRRNKWGRPYRERKKRYGKAVCVTVTMSEYNMLLDIAKKSGKTLSSLLRHLATTNMLGIKRKLLGDFMP